MISAWLTVPSTSKSVERPKASVGIEEAHSKWGDIAFFKHDETIGAYTSIAPARLLYERGKFAIIEGDRLYEAIDDDKIVTGAGIFSEGEFEHVDTGKSGATCDRHN
jgi:hypothetical protein